MKYAKEIVNYLQKELRFADLNERNTIVFWLMEHYLSLNRAAILVNKEVTQTIDWQPIITRLNANEPIQYVIGESEFFGRKFTVNPDVLIPRPETEELVELALNLIKKDANSRILDIGTGSGCIAISIAAERSDATVSAFDISEKALAIAQHNANRNNVIVDFQQVDILKNLETTKKYDLVVSNPPYVTLNEAAEMLPNVLEHEPHLALFVNDDSPLIFYEAIAQFCINNVEIGGKVVVEINAAFGVATQKCFEDAGFPETKLIKDMQQNDRFVVAFR